MPRQTLKEGPSESQDWTRLRMNDTVTVVEPRGHSYKAVLENKTSDSAVIWIRRMDINTRHLIECHDGIRVLPVNGPSGSDALLTTVHGVEAHR